MTGPFEGLKVLELGRFIAVPYCAQLLADGGAEVIKIEPVIGDGSRRTGPIWGSESRQYLNRNRGKQSVAVDLANETVLAAVQSLAGSVDVVLANFRPGLAERLQLSYEAVSAVNPGVIYAECTGYGKKGPLADAPGLAIVLQARAGIAHFTENGPQQQYHTIVDYAAGLLMAWGVSTALYQRERSGRGQRLDVSLLQAALVLQNNAVMHVDVADEWRNEFIDYLKTAFARGDTWADVVERRESLLPYAGIWAYYGFFQTRDGTIEMGGAGLPLQQRIARVLELDDRFTTEPGWEPEDARAHASYVQRQVEDTLATRKTDEWLETFANEGIPAAPVLISEELVDDEQVIANDYLVRLDHELVGEYTAVGPPVQFSDTPLVAKSASPPLGRDTRSVLERVGLSNSAIDELIEAEAAVAP